MQQALDQQVNLTDVGLDSTINDVDRIIQEKGVFVDSSKKTDENTKKLSREIVWNEVLFDLVKRCQNVAAELDIVRDIQSQNPQTLEELNRSLVQDRDAQRHGLAAIDRMKMNGLITFLNGLSDMEGAGFEEVDIVKPIFGYGIDTVKWVNSLPEEPVKEKTDTPTKPSSQPSKLATMLSNLGKLFGRQ